MRRLFLGLALTIGVMATGTVPAEAASSALVGLAAPTSTTGARYSAGGWIIVAILLVLAALIMRRRFRR